MTSNEYLDRPPAGWFALDVVKAGKNSCRWDWVGLMVDVHPDELKNCVCTVAMLYVDPKDYHPDRSRIAREAWIRVPGKHRTKEAAWDALQDLMTATLH